MKHFLKPKKSSGFNEITSKILKACASFSSHPLSYILFYSFLYNQSLYSGIFPDLLKIATVEPLYKKADKAGMTNCRPISLLTLFHKLIKNSLHIRLGQHLYTNNVCVCVCVCVCVRVCVYVCMCVCVHVCMYV
jgi:hypothetical protein